MLLQQIPGFIAAFVECKEVEIYCLSSLMFAGLNITENRLPINAYAATSRTPATWEQASPDHPNEDWDMSLVLLVLKYELSAIKSASARPVYNISLPAFLLKVFCLCSVSKTSLKTISRSMQHLIFPSAVLHPKEVNKKH